MATCSRQIKLTILVIVISSLNLSYSIPITNKYFQESNLRHEIESVQAPTMQETKTQSSNENSDYVNDTNTHLDITSTDKSNDVDTAETGNNIEVSEGVETNPNTTDNKDPGGEDAVDSYYNEDNDSIDKFEISNSATNFDPAIEDPIVTSNMQALRNLRPGMRVLSYSVDVEPNGNTFNGRLTTQVIIDDGTQEEPVVFYAEDLNIIEVYYGITTIITPREVDFTHSDGILEIIPPIEALSYFFLIIYTGRIRNDGTALYRGSYNDEGANTYLGMNLYPTHARRVFPCVDEPTNTAALTLTVNNAGYSGLVSNAINEGDVNNARFSPLSTATHLWGMIAHSLINLNVPAENLRLYGRQGVGTAQTSYISIMIQSIFTQLNAYTEKNYFEIDANAEQYLHIFALPDITREWRSLSTIGVWEPYMLMNDVHSLVQRKTALMTITNALAAQWFGYVIFPENWRYSWILEGLKGHVAYEVAQRADPDINMDVIFVSEVIQEAMYGDAYSNVLPLEANEDLYDEEIIRQNINGLARLKPAAIMNMLKYVLSSSNDYVQSAASSILNGRSLQSINSLQFYDSVNSAWLFSGDGLIEEVQEFLDPWIHNSGYPVITVATSTAGNTVVVTQERFSFTNLPQVIYPVPLTYTTRFNPNFENTQPDRVLDSSGVSFGVNVIDPELDWIIFNIQGRGYYRVNYDFDLWEKIIWSLEDPAERDIIHPLNRATLVDDALNLARAGRLDYDIAFQVVLTMEHETSYPAWKSFIRNMDFLKKRLTAFVFDEDDLDDDIYLRMVRRSIKAVERDLGFSPDPLLNEPAMTSMTRGLVMEHACKSLYQPCIAAAIDWFYDGNEINTNIPSDLRPAVYCTMVREGDANIRELLWNKYNSENVHWEKVVILKSLACSREQNYILALLQETITDTTAYGTEERSIIFKAVAESSMENADLAFRFLQSNVNAMMNTYGGVEKIEEVLMVLSENLYDGLAENFINWANTFWVADEQYAECARRAAAHALENLQWDAIYLQAVYDWIDENDATGLQVSALVMLLGLITALLLR